jgi:hypothetical protein
VCACVEGWMGGGVCERERKYVCVCAYICVGEEVTEGECVWGVC